MKQILRLLTVASASLLAVPAAAQMFPGDDVIVNPGAIPGSPAYGQTYRIHKPHHHHVVKKQTVAASDTVTATPAEMTTTPATAPDNTPAAAPAADTTPPPAPTKKHRHAKAETAAAAPAAEPQSGGLGFSFGDDEPPAPAPAANTRTASNETPAPQATKPGKPDASMAGLAKRGAILFEHNSTDPQPSQMDGIKLLAGDLNSALEAGATQIQLLAFGGTPGDKGSDAKRISLKRALAIRQLLIDNGVPSNKIITKAMGGAPDGEPDRVDIYVRA